MLHVPCWILHVRRQTPFHLSCIYPVPYHTASGKRGSDGWLRPTLHAAPTAQETLLYT